MLVDDIYFNFLPGFDARWTRFAAAVTPAETADEANSDGAEHATRDHLHPTDSYLPMPKQIF